MSLFQLHLCAYGSQLFEQQNWHGTPITYNIKNSMLEFFTYIPNIGDEGAPFWPTTAQSKTSFFFQGPIVSAIHDPIFGHTSAPPVYCLRKHSSESPSVQRRPCLRSFLDDWPWSWAYFSYFLGLVWNCSIFIVVFLNYFLRCVSMCAHILVLVST